MSPNKVAILKEQFAPWFEGLDQSPQESCLAWGLEVQDGWYDIIYNLCLGLKALADAQLLDGKAFRVEQVKEKFGGLRFYVSGVTDQAYALIELAERQSLKTCEACGSTKDVTTEGSWLKTYCKNCRSGKSPI